MYKIIVECKLGDYLKSENGLIYKITGVSVNISFNEDSLQEEARLLYEGVDARDPFGQFFIISGHMVNPATREEVDEYILGVQACEDLQKSNVGLNNSDPTLIKEKERSIDDILDDYLKYEDLVGIIGDEEGKYRDKMNELSNEFNEVIK